MVTVFNMPDKWLYLDDPDLHQLLLDAKRSEIVIKMNEQRQIANEEEASRRVEFHFVCGDKTIHTTAFLIDPQEETVERVA